MLHSRSLEQNLSLYVVVACHVKYSIAVEFQSSVLLNKQPEPLSFARLSFFDVVISGQFMNLRNENDH